MLVVARVVSVLIVAVSAKRLVTLLVLLGSMVLWRYYLGVLLLGDSGYRID